MVYAATIVVIIYWKPYKTSVIHIAHHVWFDEYNYSLSIEYDNNPGYLLLHKDPEGHIHHSYFLNLITCEVYITPTPFSNTIIITYTI